MLTAETKRRIDACRDVLVGKLPLPTDQVELITLALIYKFMDDLDEESVRLGGKRSFFTGPLAKYRWRNLLPQTVSADERMILFAEGIEAIGKAEHLPALFRDIFRNAFLKFRDGRILTLFLNELNGFVYSHSEELGNAFEYLLMCMGIQGENGQFRTPRHITNFMVACLDPQPGDRILDPACGTGGFLVSAYKHILAHHTSPGSTNPGDKLTHDQRQKLYSNLTGYDTTDLMVKLTKVNLFLHGFPDPAIHIYDTLSNDARWNEKADVILANPPFMTPKGGVTPHTKFRIAAKKAEVLFTDYIAEHLTPEGRGGVIVPNGIVATTQNAYVKLRKFLVEDSLVAVVSLPAGVFKPYSGVKTSILFLDKKLARQTKEILFLKITADGFDLGDQRREISVNDLPEAERLVKAWVKGQSPEKTETTLAWKLTSRADLLANRGVNLSAENGGEGSSIESDHKVVPLGEVCSILNGFAFKSEEYVESETGLRIIRIANVQKGEIVDQAPKFYAPEQAAEFARYSLSEGDILLSLTGNVGRAGRIPRAMLPALLNQRVAKIVPDTVQIEPAYLFHLLNEDRFEREACRSATGAAQQNLSTRWIETYEIPLPPLEEQRRIVAEIEGYQKVLDGARQILAVYQPRLQFDPAWPTTRLGEICEVVRGSSPRPQGDPKFFGGPVPRLMIADITRDGMWVTPKIDSLTEEGAKRSRPMNAGDVVMAVSASPGLPTLLKVNACIHDGFAGLKGIPTTLDRIFLYYVLLELRAEHDAQADGATFRNITTDQIRQFEIPIPPVEEQRRLVAALDAEAAQMESVRSLLPRFEAKIQRVLDCVWKS